MEPELGNKCLLIPNGSLEGPIGISVTHSSEVWGKAEANETSEALVSDGKFKGAPRNSIIKRNNILI